MRKIYLCICLIAFLPFNIFADEYTEVASMTKYYKTQTVKDGLSVKEVSYVEITKSEFDNIKSSEFLSLQSTSNGYVETNYKKLSTSILKNGSKFKYKANLEWKNIPSVRSYDILAIGFLPNVEVINVEFSQNYCFIDGKCNSSFNYFLNSDSRGVGAYFSLPSGSLKSLKQTLTLHVKKVNASSTIYKQNVYGDYSHAVKSIKLTSAKKFTVETNKINLDSSIVNYYDSIDSAKATWNGTW